MTSEQFFQGTLKKEAAAEYGHFSGYDILHIDKDGNQTVVARDVDPALASFIMKISEDSHDSKATGNPTTGV